MTGDLSGLYAVLGGGGGLALIGTILGSRSGRQRDFDARQDRELEQIRDERDDERGRRVAAEGEALQLQLETVRLRRLLIERGIDPDPSPHDHHGQRE